MRDRWAGSFVRGIISISLAQEDRMSALPTPAFSRMTVAEFIDWPGDGSELKHQLIDGEIQAMSPASSIESATGPTS